MTKLVVVLVVLLLISAAFVALLWNLISRAVNNAFDWFILTFGNDEAVARLKREREWNS